MKYVVSFTPRHGGSPADTEIAEKRSMEVFSKWTPPEGVTFHQFLARLDTGGGYAVVESHRRGVQLRGLGVERAVFAEAQIVAPRIDNVERTLTPRAGDDCASRFAVTEETVKSHLKHIAKKLNTSSRAAAVAVYAGIATAVTGGSR